MAFPWLKTGEGPPNKGKTLSDVVRAKISATKKRLYADGLRSWNTGKTMNYSQEHIEKIRQTGKNNIGRKPSSEEIEKRTKLFPGDKFVDPTSGYVMICDPSYYIGKKRIVPEHKLIAENALGRKLARDEVVHHINGDRSDNRTNNLLICTRAYHQWLHGRMSYLFQRLMFSGGVI